MVSLSSLPSSFTSSCPPHELQDLLDKRVYLEDMEKSLFHTLQSTLKELGLPKTRDWTPLCPTPGDCYYTEMCICVLGSPLPYLSLLLEAGQVSPGDSLLCLSPSWLSRSASMLLVHTAVAFDLGGHSSLLQFNPPRRVTYFLSCAPFAGEDLTRGTDCPMGGSDKLGQFWGDILTARVLLQREKIKCPATLALLLPPAQRGVEEGHVGDTEVVFLDSETQKGTDFIQNKIHAFLECDALKQAEKVVLRSTGGRCVNGVAGPIYLPQGNKEEVCKKVQQLLSLLLPGQSVLVEAYIAPLRPGPQVQDHRHVQCTDCSSPTPELSFRVCAIVTRSPQNVPLLYKLVCKVGSSGAPLSHLHSLSQSLETTLSDLGFTDTATVASLRRQVTNAALACFRVVMETESGMTPEQRGGISAQSDLIGVDLLLTVSNSVISTIVLGLHPSLCLHSSFQKPGFGGSGTQSDCHGNLLHTPLTRSQCYLMEGKTILIIGAGGFSKKFVWEAAKKYHLKIMLVESDPSHFASHLVDHFFPLPDLPDHRRDDQHCVRICEWVAAAGRQPDGCVCFWDDCVILTALVCQKLGLRGLPVEAAHIAKEKSSTHLHLLGLTKVRPALFAGGMPANESNTRPFMKKKTALSESLNHCGELRMEERSRQLDLIIDDVADIERNSLRAMMEFGRDREKMALKGEYGKTHQPLCGGSDTPVSTRLPCPGMPLLSPCPSAYAVPCAHIESALDLKNAVNDEAERQKVRFPAIMKLEYGAGAVGVKKVESLEESLAHLEKIAGDLREETDYPGIGLGFGNAMTLMEFICGTEHDVDLLLFDGQLEGAFVSDNGPTRMPSFTETAAQMPSSLPADKREQLVQAAYHSCLACGLRDGVFNVELKMTTLGPRLIEINARMGGFYLRDWIQQLYGVDILLAAFMVACGIPPRLPSATALPALGHFVGIMCVVSQHLQALKTIARPERLRQLHQEGALWLNELEDEIISGEYEEPYCNVAVRGVRPDDAHQRLLALCQGLGLHCPPHYDLEYFLSHFK
ncbi:carnosine synthase 1-like isoform X2 [Scleropages formosus]|uniref:carnosine synthase 1-like isoform X2 n=1 Tax=Scleropages formosus TaxID=113540 RepID=UPI0008787CAB|nr:carnosine synthase 1 isoform X2 [Scleropages formosus]